MPFKPVYSFCREVQSGFIDFQAVRVVDQQPADRLPGIRFGGSRVVPAVVGAAVVVPPVITGVEASSEEASAGARQPGQRTQQEQRAEQQGHDSNGIRLSHKGPTFPSENAHGSKCSAAVFPSHKIPLQGQQYGLCRNRLKIHKKSCQFSNNH